MKKREEQIRQAASFSNMISNDFIRGAIWADEHPKEGFWDKEKVIKWLKENVWGFTYLDEGNNAMIDEDTLINELIKVMEE